MVVGSDGDLESLKQSLREAVSISLAVIAKRMNVATGTPRLGLAALRHLFLSTKAHHGQEYSIFNPRLPSPY